MLKRISITAIGFGLVSLALVMAAAQYTAARYYFEEGASRAKATLRLTSQSLEGRLRRFEALPVLLADDEIIRAAVAQPQNNTAVFMANQWLRHQNATLSASVIYAMTADGRTVAASNFERPDSFIGQNFEYRPYFTQALNGGQGRFFALGTTSGVRGYYFASPVRDKEGSITGVIALKIDLDEIEAEWRAQEYHILVSDPDGIIFLSTDPVWVYRGLLPLSSEQVANIKASRQYADADISKLPLSSSTAYKVPLITLSGSDGQRREYLVAKQFMPVANWTVHVLLHTASIREQTRLAAALAILLAGAFVLLFLMLRQRRYQLAERITSQERAKLDLERRVAERTADLERVNQQIETEIAERRVTERELRRTQDDLVQAGKLAALGQMSAALSHEINQPLAAARNYADSAVILIDRGESAKAQENVAHIVSLIDRMATIAKHLRNVARKPDTPLLPVDLSLAIKEAVTFSQSRLDGAKVRLSVKMPKGPLVVRAGAVRLQQVLANLLSNAADAVEGSRDKRVIIHLEGFKETVHVGIRDYGPGVPLSIIDRIFDPFFTTKRVGSGLGLGLSISYNIMKDFGGDLRVSNEPGGGVCFTLVLNCINPQHILEQ